MMLQRCSFSDILVYGRRISHIKSDILPQYSNGSQVQVLDTGQIANDNNVDVKFEQKSVLERCNEDISHVAPYLKPTFNFAAYVNKSETLQKLVKLGVDLHKIEKRPNAPSLILQLDFEKDIKNHILFLSDLGVPNDELGRFITKNPMIFQEDLDNLLIRINYLKSKKFTDIMITRVITKNPFWLMFDVPRIDKRLGFFQKEFMLTGNEIRKLTTQQPRLITYSYQYIKLNTFVIKEEMGFTPEETKSILLRKPDLFMKGRDNIFKTFEFIHKTMKISLERIAEFPEVLLCRSFKVEQRYLFLNTLGKAQFNQKLPNYVSLLSLVSGSDVEFCENIAKSSIQAFNTFLKSL